VLDACSDIRSLDFACGLADEACIAELLELGLLIQDGRQLLSLVLPASSVSPDDSHHQAETSVSKTPNPPQFEGPSRVLALRESRS